MICARPRIAARWIADFALRPCQLDNQSLNQSFIHSFNQSISQSVKRQGSHWYNLWRCVAQAPTTNVCNFWGTPKERRKIPSGWNVRKQNKDYMHAIESDQWWILCVGIVPSHQPPLSVVVLVQILPGTLTKDLSYVQFGETFLRSKRSRYVRICGIKPFSV